MIVYVERVSGPGSAIKGVYMVAQLGLATEAIQDTDPAVVAFRAALVPDLRVVDLMKSVVVLNSASFAGLTTAQKAKVHAIIDNAATVIIANL